MSDRGRDGRDGRDGAPGETGPPGEQGERGLQGQVGPRGPQGQRGEKGDKGDVGEPGPAGGPRGLQGETGPQGERGFRGFTGEQGQKGETGPRGAQGPQGPVGPMPDHRWEGTSLQFEQPDGTWGRKVDLQGPKGDAGRAAGGGAARITRDRIAPIIVSTTSAATLEPNLSSFDGMAVTDQAEALAFASPVGSFSDGRRLTFRLKDHGTPQALSYAADYFGLIAPLPAVTVANKTMHLGFLYNADLLRWELVALATEI